ncbi:MAG: NADH-quinone oxidoreductase subunit NuoK [Porphyromonadaceae bacterium]|nr:NADH-quinone oxidoreductase subunit NuoK [Porphyromonadaceae bacterium]
MGELLIDNAGAPVPILAYQLVSLIIFFAGIYGFFTRRNLMMMLISVELILNAADINFAVFNRYLYPGEMDGMFFALFTIAIAACETAVAIAIIINVYRNFGNAEVDNLKNMKG